MSLVEAELLWAGGARFGATSDTSALVIDSDGAAGPSPMQAVAMALAGCMAIDVVSILEKGRHPLKGLRVSLSGERAPQPPKRFLRLALAFHVTGDVPAAAVERAVARHLLLGLAFASPGHRAHHRIRHPSMITARRGYLDWLRGVAVLIMIESHALDAWTAVAERERDSYGFAMMLAGFGAPIFLFLAGLSARAGGRRADGAWTDRC